MATSSRREVFRRTINTCARTTQTQTSNQSWLLLFCFTSDVDKYVTTASRECVLRTFSPFRNEHTIGRRDHQISGSYSAKNTDWRLQPSQTVSSQTCILKNKMLSLAQSCIAFQCYVLQALVKSCDRKMDDGYFTFKPPAKVFDELISQHLIAIRNIFYWSMNVSQFLDLFLSRTPSCFLLHLHFKYRIGFL